MAYLLIGLVIIGLVVGLYLGIAEALSEWLFGKGLLVEGGNDLGSWSEAFLFLWVLWVPLVLLAVLSLLYFLAMTASRRTFAVLPDGLKSALSRMREWWGSLDSPEVLPRSAIDDGAAPPVGPREGVRARMPRDADDFESVAAEWMQSCGVQVQRTIKGRDGGLDLRGGGYAGQCKMYSNGTVGAPDIQQLFGASQGYGKAIFFHYGKGYTDPAKQEARKLGVALWRLDPNAGTFKRVS